ncbi:lamin tail domain-containing protein, partial [Bacteroidota bacterium]
SNYSGKIFEVDFGSLSNSKDGVIVYDFRGAVIDSMMYESSWGGGNGKSLERLSLTESSCDPQNWIACLNETGSSVGEVNSAVNICEYNYMDLVFNEIMFDPADDNTEYIEIYNRGSVDVEIGAWSINDETENKYFLSQASRIISPGEFYLIAADSSIINYYSLQNFTDNISIQNESSLSLSNSGEKITLKDLWGNTIDSISYDPDWHNRNILTTKNKSLEKINCNISSCQSSNWSTSVNEAGGTPGIVNSINLEALESEARISISPNPFSPDNDGYEDHTIISYTLTQTTAQMRMKVFDSKGRLVREILNNQPSGSSGSIIFDGLNDDGRPLKIGIYIIFIEALNSASGVVDVLKDVVVVARRL